MENKMGSLRAKLQHNKKAHTLRNWWVENRRDTSGFNDTRIVVIKAFKEEWFEPLLTASTNKDILVWADCLQSQYKYMRRLVEDPAVESQCKAKAHIIAIPLSAVTKATQLPLDVLKEGEAFKQSQEDEPISHNEAHRALSRGDATAFMTWTQVNFFLSRGFLPAAHGYSHLSPETGGMHASLSVTQEYCLSDIPAMRGGFEDSLGYLPEIILAPYGISSILTTYYNSHAFSWVLNRLNTMPLHVIL